MTPFCFLGKKHNYQKYYVAVNHEGSWLRGIMDQHQTLWLIDYGKKIDVHLDKELRDLPESFKGMPSMIARGSLQYIVPVEKMLDQKSEHWIEATRSYCEDIFGKADQLIFQVNEVSMIEETVVNLGEILIELEYGETLKVSEEVCHRKWGLRDVEYYLENLNSFYTPVPTLAIALTKYIKNKSDPDEELSWDDQSSASSASTLVKVRQNMELVQGKAKDAANFRKSSHPQVVNISSKEDDPYWTGEELSKMQNKFVVINGRKLDVVTVLRDKIADVNMALKYANFDEISIGRACKRRNRATACLAKRTPSEMGSSLVDSIKFISKKK